MSPLKIGAVSFLTTPPIYREQRKSAHDEIYKAIEQGILQKVRWMEIPIEVEVGKNYRGSGEALRGSIKAYLKNAHPEWKLGIDEDYFVGLHQRDPAKTHLGVVTVTVNYPEVEDEEKEDSEEVAETT